MAYDTYTKLIINFNGASGTTAYTAETGQTVTFVGTSALDNTQAKFGATSLVLDGNSDYVTVPDSADWYFATGDFTLDAWIYYSADVTGTIMSQYVDDNNKIIFGLNNTKLYFLSKDGGTIRAYYPTTANAVPANQWSHVAFVRNGTTVYFFIDGVATTYSTTNAISTNAMANLASAMTIGYDGNFNLQYFGGWIDSPRISKGIARWTANFTPPIRQYYGGVISKYMNTLYDNTTVDRISKINGQHISGINKVLTWV